MAEKDAPANWQFDDALRALLVPILKSDKPRKTPCLSRCGNRAIFDGLDWSACIGSHWSQLPRAFDLKSTVYERFTKRVGTEVLQCAREVLFQTYDERVGLGWESQVADGCIVGAPLGRKGARATAASPADRSRPGTQCHLLTEAAGTPVVLVVTGGNLHDMTQFAALPDGTVVEPAPSEQPHLVLDRGDDDSSRDTASAPGDTAHTPSKYSAERSPPPSAGPPDRHPPRHWVVKTPHCWFDRMRLLPPAPRSGPVVTTASATSRPS